VRGYAIALGCEDMPHVRISLSRTEPAVYAEIYGQLSIPTSLPPSDFMLPTLSVMV